MCGSVHPVSSPSTQSVAVVERSTIEEPGRFGQTRATTFWQVRARLAAL
jgi:hypothetical protein